MATNIELLIFPHTDVDCCLLLSFFIFVSFLKSTIYLLLGKISWHDLQTVNLFWTENNKTKTEIGLNIVTWEITSSRYSPTDWTGLFFMAIHQISRLIVLHSDRAFGLDSFQLSSAGDATGHPHVSTACAVSLVNDLIWLVGQVRPFVKVL